MSAFKWDERSIRVEFRLQHPTIQPNMAKILKFQRFTDSMEECVEWAINSLTNDEEQRRRETGHGTGAV